ncbi:MAG: BamA/TamA family outer membrane protein [Gemmatimonadota bacterium]
MNRHVGWWWLRCAGSLLFLVCLRPAGIDAQQPPFEGAVSPEPLEPRERLTEADLEGPDAILFGVHRVVSLGLAPLVEFGVEKGLIGSGSGSIEGFRINPGSLGSNSGIGLSVGYVAYPAPVWAGASVGYTTKRYQEHEAFVGVRTDRGDRYLRVTGSYDLDTEDEFAGLGMDSPEFIDEDEQDPATDYRQEEIRLLGDGAVLFAENVRVGARGGWRKNNLRGGENDDVEDTQAFFQDSLLPGVGAELPGISGEAAEYGQYGGFLAYDSRNDPNNPDRGLLLAGSADLFRGVSETPFDVDRFAGELVGYLPLPDETRVFAVRLLGVHQEPGEDQVLVPFYYLSSLGGGSFLRSFSSFRFQDNDLLYGAAELRRRVWTEAAGQAALDASLFVESGGVYRDLTEDVSLGDMEQSFGTELRILAPNDVVARLGAALGSSEGAKLYLSGGGRF